MSNIKTIAKTAGVSIATVSRVINKPDAVSDALKLRVHQAIDDLQYSVNPIASTLKSARRNQIAVVVPTMRQNYLTDIIKGINDVCYEKNVLPTILETARDFEREKSIIANVAKQWVDGIIIFPSRDDRTGEALEYERSLCNLRKRNRSIPVVIAEGEHAEGSVDTVCADYEKGFLSAAYHLLEIGRRRIAFLCMPSDSPMYDAGVNGYLRALKEWDIPHDPSLLFEAGFTVMDGYSSCKRMLSSGIEIDAFMCANDQIASGALQACHELGLSVPRQIAITGFGGIALSIITTPALTSVVIPRYDIGREAATLLFDRIEGYEGEVRNLVFGSHLAIRTSTLQSAVKDMDSMYAEMYTDNKADIQS